MYLQWSKIDVGQPDFRESNRLFYIFWEACKADVRCYGMCYLKNRRSGFSFMSSAESVNLATISTDSRFGILSKSGPDAKKMFTDKVVPISVNYPFFFKPIQDGMDRPKTELAYRVPASKFTRRKLDSNETLKEITGLDTTIDWKNTGDNSYDGEKLKLLVHDESGKWERPNNILNNWRVTKTTLRLGSKVIGKCMMGSTSNALDKGGDNFKKLYYDSDVNERNANGQTRSGLYSLFIPMEWNYEGYINSYGIPVFDAPKKDTFGPHGQQIRKGVIEYWQNEVDGLSRATMGRPGQSSHGGSHRCVQVGVSAGHYARGEGGCVGTVLGVQHHVHIHQCRGVIAGCLAADHVKEVGSMGKIRTGRDGSESVADPVVCGDDHRHLRGEPDRFADGGVL